MIATGIEWLLCRAERNLCPQVAKGEDNQQMDDTRHGQLYPLHIGGKSKMLNPKSKIKIQNSKYKWSTPDTAGSIHCCTKDGASKASTLSGNLTGLLLFQGTWQDLHSFKKLDLASTMIAQERKSSVSLNTSRKKNNLNVSLDIDKVIQSGK